MTEHRRFAVLGAGIGGLTAAWQIARVDKSARISVLEKSTRTGGWINSERHPASNNISPIFEAGPRTLRPVGQPGAATLDMIRSLGLSDRIIKVSKSSPSAKRRYILYNNELNLLPSSLLGMLTPPPVMRTALGGFAREIFVPPFKGPPDADESIHSFISRRFNTALSENIVSAVIHGIYAGDVKKLSVRSTMMRGMWDMERKHGGLVRGTIASIFNSPPNEEDLVWKLEPERQQSDTNASMEFVRDMQKDTSVYSFPEGLQELSDALERSLVKSGRVEFVNDEVECMDFKGWKGVEIRSTKGRIEADAVISALPANQLSRVLSASNTYTPSLAFEPKQVASLLSKIKFISVAVVNFAFTLPSNQSDLPKALQDGGGFGYLVPSSANSPVLGVVFDSSAVPAQDGGAKILRLTAMLGGHRFEEFFGDPDKADQEEILGIALETGIKRFLGLDLSKAILIASRVVVNKECIPQYYVGHNTLLEEIHESLLGGQLAVVGSSYLGVGINDVILNARKVASGIAQGDNSLTGLGDVQ